MLLQKHCIHRCNLRSRRDDGVQTRCFTGHPLLPSLSHGPIKYSCNPSSSFSITSTSVGLLARKHEKARLTSAHALPELAPERPPAKLAVFVSGGGSNMKALHAAILDGRLNAEITAVVSDKPSCGGVQYAQAHGIKALTYPIPKSGEYPGLTASEIVDELKTGLGIDFVILAGYLKLIPPELVKAFPRAMLNIHPGLLPGFGGKGMYGERVHKAVIASGARFSGPTIHFVDEEFDTGPILAQAIVPVKPTDTPKKLAARVLVQEHALYPHAVSALVDGRISWREDGIPILWSDS